MTDAPERSKLQIAELMRDVRSKLQRIATDAVGLLASAGQPDGINVELLHRVDHSIVFLEHAIQHLVEVDGVQSAESAGVIDLAAVVACEVEAHAERDRIDHVATGTVMVRGDVRHLRFAVSSLIGAALEAAPARSVVLVRTTREGSTAQVAVVAVARPEESGLAMRVARHTAELHGGTATVREMIGLTRWTIELPVVMSGVSVLIVDDNVEQVAALVELLRKPGMVIDYATSGGQALARIATNMPDVLVVDVQIPDISGVEVIRQARERQPDLPVVLLTGYPPDHPMIVGATADGRSTYIGKPVNVDALIEVVANAARVNERSP